MKNQPFQLTQIDGFEITLYDANQKILAGIGSDNVDFSQQFYHIGSRYYYLDQSPQLHHGVQYILIKYDISDTNYTIQKWVIIIATATVFVVFFVGYFLSKMFLKPIQNQRVKLDRFIKDTTHELNTPISALLMSISSLKLKPQSGEIMERIEISAKRINKIYSDMSYLLLNSSKEQQLSLINLKTIIENELQLYEILANKKKITITKELEDCTIKIFHEDIQRVVSNLISNSIKYNKKGGNIAIQIVHNTLIIKDSGMGIEEQNLTRIFERYFREVNHEGGFGIGMDIVRTVCDKYGIQITIESKVDIGTAIRLDFGSIVADLSD